MSLLLLSYSPECINGGLPDCWFFIHNCCSVAFSPGMVLLLLLHNLRSSTVCDCVGFECCHNSIGGISHPSSSDYLLLLPSVDSHNAPHEAQRATWLRIVYSNLCELQIWPSPSMMDESDALRLDRRENCCTATLCAWHHACSECFICLSVHLSVYHTSCRHYSQLYIKGI